MNAARQAAAPVVLTIDLSLESGDWPPEPHLAALARRAVDAAMATGLPAAPDSEVSIVFTDDSHVRMLNRDWRDQDKPTNVLSFPGMKPRAGLYGPLLGDIVLACETIRRESAEGGLTLDAHLAHLIVHGLLHLFGHDHVADEDAELMESLETGILASLGIEDPYAGSDVDR